MSTISYRDFTGTAAENYQRYFVPAIAAGVRWPARGRPPAARRARPRRRLRYRWHRPARGRSRGIDGLGHWHRSRPDMIDVARATPAPAEPLIDWHIGDAARLPFPDDTYDSVLCQMGLMFISDRSAVIAEMRRTLVPGGRVVISTPGAIQPPFEILGRALVEHIGADLGGFVRAVFSMHDPGAVASILRGADLRDVTATTRQAMLQLPAPADFLWQYINLTPMAPIVDRAPEAARKAMERDIVERWQPFVGEGGAVVGEQPMVIGIGWK
jgi:trans-aconitate methyltransferase